MLSTQPHRLTGLAALTLPGWEGKAFYTSSHRLRSGHGARASEL